MDRDRVVRAERLLRQAVGTTSEGEAETALLKAYGLIAAVLNDCEGGPAQPRRRDRRLLGDRRQAAVRTRTVPADPRRPSPWITAGADHVVDLRC